MENCENLIAQIKGALNKPDEVSEADFLRYEEDLATLSNKLLNTNEGFLSDKIIAQLITIEETRSVNSLIQDGALEGVTRLKWIDNGLRFYPIMSQTQNIDLRLKIFMNCFLMIMLSSDVEVKKSKIVLDLGSSADFTDCNLIVNIVKGMSKLKIITGSQFKQLFEYVKLEVTKDSGAFGFLKIFPISIVKNNLWKSILEFDLVCLSKFYNSISFTNLFEINLKLSDYDETELIMLITDMVASGRLYAKIDQSKKMLTFDRKRSSKEKLIYWQRNYMNYFLEKVENCSDIIVELNWKS